MQSHNSGSKVSAFCKRYNMHPSTYYRKLPFGEVPPFVKFGHSSIILLEDENAWLERLKNGELGNAK